MENPVSIDNNTFSDNTFYNATLYVPKGAIDKYKGRSGWKKFVFIEEEDGGSDTPPDPEKCATPTISYVNGELAFACETEGVEFVSEITDTDIRKFYDAKVSLSVTYTITVYATKAGYDNSDVATATLCWIDAEPKTEGLEEDAVTEVKALPVLIQTEGSLITVRGLDAGTEVSAYSTNGMLLDSAVSAQGTAILRTSLTSGSTAIIKIGQKAVKVIVK